MKYNQLFLLLLSVILVGPGCIKSDISGACTDKLVTSEAAAMQAYAATNSIPVIEHPSGILYNVIAPGSGPIASGTNLVFVKYSGKLISNNVVFDSQTNSALTGWALQTLIPGWQIGIPLIAEGGKIQLIIPSSLAYGCRGAGTIPPDAILFFEIELVDIQ